jgi:hypothetical protein
MASILEGHYLVTESPSRGGRITHRALCQCDKVFMWQAREEDHAQHILAVVWELGFAAGGDEQINLYWDATSLNQVNPFGEAS